MAHMFNNSLIAQVQETDSLSVRTTQLDDSHLFDSGNCSISNHYSAQKPLFHQSYQQ